MKKCSKCGEVKPFSEFHRRRDRVSNCASQCKECDKKRKKIYITKNKEKIKQKKEENKEHTSNYFKNYRKNNKKKCSENVKKSTQKAKENLNDSYIKRLLSKNSTLKAKDFNDQPELIELKRLQIQTERLCKTSKS